MDKFDSWLNQIHDEEGELAYRAVYSAYRLAMSGDEVDESRAKSRRGPDGSFEIHAGRESITLVDHSERVALAQFIAGRYCNDDFPTMAEWERQQDDDWEDRHHYWGIEDPENWHTPWTPWKDLKRWVEDKWRELGWWWARATSKRRPKQ
ncbi:hypothetical protein [Nocardia sp. IFM 10818]